MNRSRYVPTMWAACTLVLAGCASGGGFGGGGGGGGGGDGLRDNEYTRSAELFLTQAEAMGAGARFQDALNAALNSIAEDPTNPVGYFQAARAQVGLGDYEAADTLLRKALEMHPAYEADVELVRDGAWRSAFGAANERMDAGNMQQAIELWESAEVIYPGRYPQAVMNLGSFYPDVGRVDDAIDAYATALEVIRDPSTAEMMMSDSAIAEEWVDFERTVVNNRAILLVQQERFTEAAADLAAYLETHPDDLDALANRAAVLVEAGMPDSAQAIYDNLLSDASLGAPATTSTSGSACTWPTACDRAAEAFRKGGGRCRRRTAMPSSCRPYDVALPGRRLRGLCARGPCSWSNWTRSVLENHPNAGALPGSETDEGLAAGKVHSRRYQALELQRS